MITGGLVSITFRQLTPGELVRLVAESPLRAIEWGGDVHVPTGNLANARAVAAQTRDAGLVTACYGSYYRLADDSPERPDWQSVVDTAAALEAPSIRVWAGKLGSPVADEAYVARVGAEAVTCAECAAQAGIKVALEFHENTVNDTANAAARLLAAVDHPNLYTLWQTINRQPARVSLEALESLIGPRLLNAHVFHWVFDAEGRLDRRPLAEGAGDWAAYLPLLDDGPDRYGLIEFVRGDDPAQFLDDARTLADWLAARR